MKKNSVFIVLGILVGLDILAWLAVWELGQERGLEVTFFDVGQGDAIFIETPVRQQILIDGGPSSIILEKLAKEMPFYDRNIDLVILTHPEKDHLFGLNEVLKRYKIENILWTGVIRDLAEYKEWLNLIQKEGAKIKIAKAGQIIKLKNSHIDILYPLENFEDKTMENSNDNSIVSRLIFNENSFLFTGDISIRAEKKLIETKTQLKSNVLKVAHHGSKYSSSDEFLENSSPELAVIQVGKNTYGHPTEEVLIRLENFAIRILRTDQNSDIKIFSDGKNIKYEVSNF